MTIRVVADTHAVLWYLYNDSRLSVNYLAPLVNSPCAMRG